MKILVVDKLSRAGIEMLEEQPDVEVCVRHGLAGNEFAAEARDAEAILVRSAAKVTAAVLASASRLRVIGRAGIGVDNIDVGCATKRGVLVMNVPDANANTTAEHTLSLLFAMARSVPAADRSVRDGLWERSHFLGMELFGKTLGVLGGGNIGRRVAHRAQGLGMKVIVHDPFLAGDALADLAIPVLSMEEFVGLADIITIHVPLLKTTRNLVNRNLICRMKNGVCIINCARGGILNETDLLAALRSGKVRGAALDVFEHEPPPRDHPLFLEQNVILTPHLGASTAEAQTRASVEICRQVVDYLRDGNIRNAVNLPHIANKTMTELAPWMDLGRRLGTLLTGILEGPCEHLEISCRGRLSAGDTTPITRAVIAGLLQPVLAVRVNLVNAMALAEERGIVVEERKNARSRDFASMLSVSADHAGRSASVAGTLFGHRQPRIVKIDHFRLEAIPEGALLVARNRDTPGVIGRMGSLLGKAGVNIRGLHLAPPPAQGDIRHHAMALFNIAPAPTARTLAQLRGLPEVDRLTLVCFDPPP